MYYRIGFFGEGVGKCVFLTFYSTNNSRPYLQYRLADPLFSIYLLKVILLFVNFYCFPFFLQMRKAS